MTDTSQGLGEFTPGVGHHRPAIHGPHGWSEVHGNEFYAKFTGMELRNFPDVPIKASPLLDTSTHKLAVETDPRWTMVIRHVGSWRMKTRPKVRIYPEGSGIGKVAVAFRLPAAHRFETPEAAFRLLESVEFTLSPHNLNLVAFQKQQTEKMRQQLRSEMEAELGTAKTRLRDEFFNSVTEDEVFALLEHFTSERRDKLPRPKRAEPDMTNVFRFEAMRERIAALLERDETADDYARSLRSAG